MTGCQMPRADAKQTPALGARNLTGGKTRKQGNELAKAAVQRRKATGSCNATGNVGLCVKAKPRQARSVRSREYELQGVFRNGS